MAKSFRMMSDDYYIDDDYIVNLPGASSFHFGRHVLRLFFLLSFLFSLLGNAVSPPVDFFGGSLRALPCQILAPVCICNKPSTNDVPLHHHIYAQVCLTVNVSNCLYPSVYSLRRQWVLTMWTFRLSSSLNIVWHSFHWHMYWQPMNQSFSDFLAGLVCLCANCITIYIVNVPCAYSGFHCTFSCSERHS